MAANPLRSARAWLLALVAGNGIVAVLAHVGAPQWLATRASPGPLLERPPADRSVCAAWGPFVETDSMQPLIAAVEAAGGEVDVVTERLAAEPGYLLLVGAQGSFAVARRVREELESQSIPNHIVPAGPFARSLQVGVFADRARALARRAHIEELGYQVELRELQHPRVVFRLIARLQRQSAPELPPAADCAVVAPAHRFL